MRNESRNVVRPGSERGATMIEVLVALLVLSIGLLGVAALQATGLRNNHSAYLRSQATVLAHDIADRMRGNRDAALNGNYNVAVGVAVPLIGGDPVWTVDLAQWKQNLANSLPAGDGAIVVPAAAGGPQVVTITVQWDDSRGANPPLQFQTQTEL